MKARFREFINKNNLLNNCQKLLLAVSGGPDSLVMLELFSELKSEFKLKIAVAHLDHMLRPESVKEAEFVEAYSKKKGFDFFLKRVDLPALIKDNNSSVEALARKLRFDFFRKIIKDNNYDLLALAHHKDDQAETVLLNLFRGAGLQGLSGIQPRTRLAGLEIIHPLLDFNKEEILAYCKQNKLQPQFDSTNNKNIYSRNIIRNEIFPLVESKISSKAREVIARSSKLIAAENDFLQRLALDKYKKIVKKETQDKIIVDFQSFKEIDQILQWRVYRQIYNKINDNLDDLYFDHILEIEKLIQNKKTGRGVDIASGIRVEISYSELIFFKKSEFKQQITEKMELKLGSETKINDKFSLETEIIDICDFSFSKRKEVAAFDYEKLKLPLSVRNRKEGDSLKPLGMSGHKKIKDILIDQKIPKYERDELPLIVDEDDNIIWLAPCKISDDYKITTNTNKVIIIRLKYNS